MTRRDARTRLRALRGDDAGVALVATLSIMFVLTLLVLGATVLVVGQQKQSRNDQDWHAALTAAQAGIEDYTARLNGDDRYWRYGRWTDICPPASTPSSEPRCEFEGLPSDNDAFTTWVDVPDVVRGKFRYDVDNSSYPLSGYIRIRASGRVGGEDGAVRTLEANVRRDGFIDYLYYTDYETSDPITYSPPRPQCETYWYDGRNTTQCNNIVFVPQDRLNGPVHSNDAMYICPGSNSSSPNGRGPVVTAATSTGYDGALTSGRMWRLASGCSGNPYFARSGDPAGPLIRDLPESNSQYREDTDPDNPDLIGPVGCRYTGPTRIEMLSNGRMRVTSPATATTHPVAGCAGGSATPVEVAVPAGGVIFVQSVPGTPDRFTNPTPPGQCKPRTTGGTARTSTGGSAIYTYEYGNRLGYPLDRDATKYDCNAGDVFLSGTLNGRLTIAAENNIVVTDSVLYAGGDNGDDMLGFVPNNFVYVYHPYTPSDTVCSTWQWVQRSSSQPRWRYECSAYYPEGNVTYDRPSVAGTANLFNNAVINAAMLAVTHSFTVQNYASGSQLGNLTVFGSIGQKYRGPVGTTGGTGYYKDYNYDKRLYYEAPPKFLTPIASQFTPKSWAEAQPWVETDGYLTSG